MTAVFYRRGWGTRGNILVIVGKTKEGRKEVIVPEMGIGGAREGMLGFWAHRSYAHVRCPSGVSQRHPFRAVSCNGAIVGGRGSHDRVSCVVTWPRGHMSLRFLRVTPGRKHQSPHTLPAGDLRPKTSRAFPSGSWSKGRVCIRVCRLSVGFYTSNDSLKRKNTEKQAAMEIEIAKRAQMSIIVMGDFNGVMEARVDRKQTGTKRVKSRPETILLRKIQAHNMVDAFRLKRPYEVAYSWSRGESASRLITFL